MTAKSKVRSIPQFFQPFANKAHEGFLGHSFIASWVNLGAGTTTSNLKNNYSNISVKWNSELIDTKSIFFGSIIGEHVKTSIGTNLNTGTVMKWDVILSHKLFHQDMCQAFHFIIMERFQKSHLTILRMLLRKAMSRRNVDFSSIETTFF